MVWSAKLAATSTPTNESTTVLTRALRALLRPLVRLLLSRQITYPALTALLKEVYVEVADEDFQLPNKRQRKPRSCEGGRSGQVS